MDITDVYLYNNDMVDSNNKTTNKTFGAFFSMLFLLFGIYLLLNEHAIYWYLPLFVVSVVLYLLRTFYQESLQPLNDGWYWIGCFIGKFSSILIFTFIFYLLVSPVALVAKLFGRDILRLRTDGDVKSYWVKRSSDDRSVLEYFKNQF